MGSVVSPMLNLLNPQDSVFFYSACTVTLLDKSFQVFFSQPTSNQRSISLCRRHLEVAPYVGIQVSSRLDTSSLLIILNAKVNAKTTEPI